MIAADRAAGLMPFWVCATRGTTSLDGLRPDRRRSPRSLAASRRVAARRRGDERDRRARPRAALGQRRRSSRADSYCTNPHKWMGVNFDCDLFWTADRAAAARGAEHPARVPPLGGGRVRRGDRLPRLAGARSAGGSARSSCGSTLRIDGVDAVQAMIRRHVDLTQELAELGRRRRPLRDRRPAPAQPAVPRAARRATHATDALIERANATGEALFTRTVLDGRVVLRFSIGGAGTRGAPRRGGVEPAPAAGIVRRFRLLRPRGCVPPGPAVESAAPRNWGTTTEEHPCDMFSECSSRSRVS